jgi:lipid-binding SYLF domain-containing protein
MALRPAPFILAVALAATPFLAFACNTAPRSDMSREDLNARVQSVISEMKARDPGMEKWFSTSYGYAVMPDIAKGAIIFGGAFGNGEVFEKGTMIGWCSVTSGTVGLSLGGGVTAQAIFFENQSALDAFKQGVVALDAQATGYAVTAGGSEKARFDHGMAVFMFDPRGLMGDASVGGQGFRFVPLSDAK